MAVDLNITGSYKVNGVPISTGGVTSVTGTAPVVSSGGTTPAISMPAATTSVDGYLTSTNWTTFNNKQAALVSGTNIKTVNSTTILGSGDLAVQATLVSGSNIKTVNFTSILGSGNITVQPTLVSGTNIKTINGASVLGSGDLVISGGVTSVTGTAPVVSSGGTTPAISMAAATTSVNGYLTSTNFNTFNNKQAALVSGTNIKTINGASVLGSGDLVVSGSQVGYRGFKYNMGIGEDFPSPPVPLAGQAFALYDGDGVSQGFRISRLDANGVNVSSFLNKLNGQTITIVNSDNSIALTGGNATLVSAPTPFYDIVSSVNGPILTDVAYINIDTSNRLNNGYSILGHLNGTVIPVGTYYASPGANTLSTNQTSRTAVLVASTDNYIYPYVRTNGIMTGSMEVKIMVNGVAAANIVIGGASAAGVYSSIAAFPNDSSLTMRFTQTGVPSCGIDNFGYKVT